ncbi:MAG: putative exported lipase/esterase [Dactylosporangium sp.]|nr:putative exported lipase/esterase [Dactylosporangium sp.]
MPPALVVNGEHDVLREEGEAYARKLSQAGIAVTQVRYGGTSHDSVAAMRAPARSAHLHSRARAGGNALTL